MFKFSFRVRGLNLGSVTFKKAGYICYSHWLLILPLPSKVLDWGSWGQILRPMKTESCLKSKDAEYTQVPWGHCTLLHNHATTRVSPKSPFSALWGWIPSWVLPRLSCIMSYHRDMASDTMGLRHLNWTKIEIDLYIKTLLTLKKKKERWVQNQTQNHMHGS